MKYKSFRKYTNLVVDGRLDEQVSLQELIDNFREVFPYAKADCKIQHFRKEGEDTNDMICYGQVQSHRDKPAFYTVTVKFHRDDTELPFTIKNLGKVDCTCNAYRYNLIHPNKVNGNQAEPIPSYASISNTVRNPDKVPSVCKHLYAFLLFLHNEGIIRND